jgi:hypothetical protein
MEYNGNSWSTIGAAGFSSNQVVYTSLNIYNGTPYLAYEDCGDYYRCGETVMKYNGNSWTAVGNKEFSVGRAEFTSLYVYNGTPYVAYQDYGNNLKATVMEYK